jgi:hypothetical protein
MRIRELIMLLGFIAPIILLLICHYFDILFKGSLFIFGFHTFYFAVWGSLDMWNNKVNDWLSKKL